MSAFDILGDIAEAAADLVVGVFGSSSPRASAHVSGGVTGRQQAKEFIRHIREKAKTEYAVVIEYEARWKWFGNAEWREMVLSEAKATGLFNKVSFDAPCSLDNEWSFGAYIKGGPAIAQASLDTRM